MRGRENSNGGVVASGPGMGHVTPQGLAHQTITSAIIKSFFEVYRELGFGFSEIVYRRALGIVLRSGGLEAIEEAPLEVRFRGHLIGRFHVDVIVGRAVLVETKAAATLEMYAQAQVLNYLKAAGGGVAMLLNFGHEPTYKRLVLGNSANTPPAPRVPADR